MRKCPRCDSTETIKNGSVRGNSKAQCNNCGRQFYVNSTKQRKPITKNIWKYAEKLLAVGTPLFRISCLTGVSRQWLKKYADSKYKSVSGKVVAYKSHIGIKRIPRYKLRRALAVKLPR